MKIKKLTLYTNRLQQAKDFYTTILGLDVYEISEDMFSVKIGWSILQFKQSPESFLYHYCFLIPSNTLQEALTWMEKRVDIVEIKAGEKTVSFDEWNATSFYDGSGNIAEFIVHYDLGNPISQQFDVSSVLGISEIGIGTDDIQNINSILEQHCQTMFWKGDFERFGTNGSAEGKFLIGNYHEKQIWFPSLITINAAPFEVEIEHNNTISQLQYSNGVLNKYTI